MDIDIPERGVRVVAPDSAGETELVWIHGVAARAEQRERFIEAIRAGGIPTPLPTSDTSVASPRVRYHSLETLHARQQTVVSLLGLEIKREIHAGELSELRPTTSSLS